MASTYGVPVNFTKEKNVWTLSAQLQFGANGAVTLVQNNSKGFCAINQESIMITGGTTNSTTALGTVSSYNGIFKGMTVAAAVAGDLQAGTTVSSVSPATQSIVLSAQAIATTAAGTYAITGGRYRLQFGTQAVTQLTPYVKLLGMNVSYDVSTGSVSGNAGAIQLAPAQMTAFIVNNNISVKVVPPTLATNSTDASIAIQFGTGQGPWGGFTAGVPQNGEIVRLEFMLGNTTAP